ncbi:MAG: hypothetical protein G01um101418_14 [Parcubacteria group bacterium Gr01-1014_18]|nr:MAG: hypothetical protein Greene041636_14 [Parcubacteria group bacterium Greene0416_36]TSC81520.1 MAG: hypothetical protein G01um101418_14 [Parcubacteria group bacterium Gr01-1014_18]TSC99669.1 MAG: hypothetical protein Greene101420_73 [Parcubacteria group bacterium Greene1014_20]TSD07120.1 MAG: hypothetical protein Greene07142_432 [Parcubacteria group bacterium Greene0714_2]
MPFYISVALNLLLILVLSWLQFGFLGSLAYPYNHIDILFSTVFFIGLWARESIGIYWVLVVGPIVSYHSIYPLASVFLSLIAVVFAIQKMSKTLFVKSSLIGTLVLVPTGMILFILLSFVLNYLAYLLFFYSRNPFFDFYISGQALRIFGSLFVSMGLYAGFQLIYRRLGSYFIY